MISTFLTIFELFEKKYNSPDSEFSKQPLPSISDMEKAEVFDFSFDWLQLERKKNETIATVDKRDFDFMDI